MAVYQSEFQGATIDARLAAVATMQTAISNLETAVAAKYSKPSSGIPETDLDASVQAALALARTAVQSLSDYYTKAQVDDITAAIAASVDSTSGVVVTALPSAGAGTLGKIYYVGPDANGFYDRYVTSYDGSTYSWLALGNTEVDMTQYATVEQFNQLDQKVTGKDLAFTPIWGVIGKYLNTSGVPSSSSTWNISSPFILAKGVTINVKTEGSGACIIAATTDGTTYTPLVIAPSGTTGLNTYSYTAKEDISIAVSAKVGQNNVEMWTSRASLLDSVDTLQTQLSGLNTKIYGDEKTINITTTGRTNYDFDLGLKAGRTYVMQIKLANTPTAYVQPEIYDAGGTRIVNWGSIRDNQLHQLLYTPAQDMPGAYFSLYVATDISAGSVYFRWYDTQQLAPTVDTMKERLGYEYVTSLVSGRNDPADKFSLKSGVKYILSAKLSNVPATYVQVELRDSANAELLKFAQMKDTAVHTGIYIPSSDLTDVYIYVYSSGSSNAGTLNLRFSPIATIGGETVENAQRADIVDANGATEMLNKFSQVKRQPRVGHTTQGITPLVLLHFSDIHGNAENLKRIVEFREYYQTFINDVLNTGDTVLEDAAETLIVDSVPGASSFLLAIGNHDSCANGEWTGYGAVATYNKYIAPYVSGWGVTQPANAAANGYNYYYKDYSDANVRLIVLDCMFWDATELAWLESTLASARTAGLAVVCASHYAGGKVTPFPIPWNTLQYTDVSDTLPSDAPAAVQAFIQAGGEFVCWISGHGHYDMVGPLDDYPAQVNIAIDTANYGTPSEYSDIQRVRFTKSEDLFNAFSVDTFNKTVRLFRVGADRDAQLRHRGDLLIDYSTAEVLYYD